MVLSISGASRSLPAPARCKVFLRALVILARRFTRTRRHFGERNRKTLSISAAGFWHTSCGTSSPWFSGLANRNIKLPASKKRTPEYAARRSKKRAAPVSIRASQTVSIMKTWLHAAQCRRSLRPLLLAMVPLAFLANLSAASLREALAEFETGATSPVSCAADQKIGRSKEVSRFQILPGLWQQYSTSQDYADPETA